jgi:RNA polymerase sigma factor (sigma-70 family)
LYFAVGSRDLAASGGGIHDPRPSTKLRLTAWRGLDSGLSAEMNDEMGMDLLKFITPLAGPAISVASAAPPVPHFRTSREPLADARELLVSNLALIERVVAFTCRRHGLKVDETEEFGGVVRLKLVENDYAVLRKFEGRSSFATFVTVVIHRMLLDYRIHLWGKWHASAEARRRGDAAVEIEKLLHRDKRTADEAYVLLSPRYPWLTREAFAEIAAALPRREPRAKLVEIDDAAAVVSETGAPFPLDRTRISELISAIVRTFIDALPAHDRLVLQLRFDSAMSVAQIARSLGVDQKQLYRTIEKRLRELRTALEASGVSDDDAADIIGDRGVVLDFRFGEPFPPREEASS